MLELKLLEVPIRRDLNEVSMLWMLREKAHMLVKFGRDLPLSLISSTPMHPNIGRICSTDCTKK